MATKLLAALVVGIVAGLTLAFFGRSSEAQPPQTGKNQLWEYKVVASGAANDAAPDKVAEDITQRYNALAAEGWEYVGLVLEQPRVSATHETNGAFAGANAGFVLFKRAKK